ncbi:hypothetical protein [Arcobacter arenosus]|uniref:hypothetical protein n=1 Tax=Arcobacter arenosus TaxID=2576037 RepID=UPI003BAB2761
MIIANIAQMTYNESDISQQLNKNKQFIESKSPNIINKQKDITSKLPNEYIPESQMNEKQLIDKKIFETILKTFASDLPSKDYEDKLIEEAKQKFKEHREELKKIKDKDELNLFLEQSREDFSKELNKPKYRTDIEFSGNFNISTSEKNYSLQISFTLERTYQKIDDENSSFDISNLKNIASPSLNNIKIDIEEIDNTDEETLSIDDLKTLLQSQKTNYEELFANRETTSENFSIINNYQTNTNEYLK